MKKNEISQTTDQQAKLLEELKWYCINVMCLEEAPDSIYQNLVTEMVKVYFGSDQYANLPKTRREVIAAHISPLIRLFEATDKLQEFLDDEELVNNTFESIKAGKFQIPTNS